MTTLPIDLLPDQQITWENVGALSMQEQIVRLRHLAMRMHVTCQVNEQHMRTKTCRELTLFLRTPTVLQSTKDFLQAINTCSFMWHNVDNAKERPINVRTFLSTYLMRLHFKELFDDVTMEVSNLTLSSYILLRQFEEIKYMLVYCEEGNLGDKVYTASNFLVENLLRYLDNYEIWRLSDQPRLINRLKYQLFNLQGAIFLESGECGEIDPERPVVVMIRNAMNGFMDRLVRAAGANEAFLFNKKVEGYIAERRMLRLLREEQRRHASKEGLPCGFDFLEL